MALEIAAVSIYSYIEPPTAQRDASLKARAGNIETNLRAEHLPNATFVSILPERAFAPQLEHGENATDVLRAPAPSGRASESHSDGTSERWPNSRCS